MSRRVLSLVIVLWIIISIPVMVNAASRLALVRPTLEFDGSTARCGVTISNDTGNIEAIIKLSKGSTTIATWKKTGQICIVFSDSIVVPSKGEYTLSVDVTFNGIKQPQVSTTATYE